MTAVSPDGAFRPARLEHRGVRTPPRARSAGGGEERQSIENSQTFKEWVYEPNAVKNRIWFNLAVEKHKPVFGLLGENRAEMPDA